MSEIAYGRTPLGQLLYDLVFTDLADKYLAQKHKIPIQSIRNMRDGEGVKDLRRQIKRDRKRRLR